MAASGRDHGNAHIAGLAAASVLGTVVLAVALVALATHTWASGLSDERRLLPGTTVAGVDVGSMSVDEAEQAVSEAFDARFDRPRTVAHDEDSQSWRVTPRELGATADAEAAVQEALAEGADAGLLELARIRWLNGSVDVDVPLDLDDAELEAFVGEVADEVDRAPRDATAEWDGREVSLVEHRLGQRVDRAALVNDLSRTLLGEGEIVDLVVEDVPVQVTSEDVEPVLPELRDSVAAAFEQRLDVVAEGEGATKRWQVTPEELGAVPDVAEILSSMRTDDVRGDQTSGGAAPAPLTVPQQELEAFVEGLAQQVYEPPSDAQLDWDADGIEITDDVPGRQLDTERAAAELDRAIRDRSDSVSMSIVPAHAAVTADDYHHVLLLRQDERRLYHFVGGQRSRDWEVAIGASGSPTPTGVFRVGSKRNGPTWHNPDPNGWGANMPEVVPPGPNNPLGVRALNWNDQNGADTLIRFHGTAAGSSIGRAASKGCVRLTNEDVVELFDRVPTGTTIISVN